MTIEAFAGLTRLRIDGVDVGALGDDWLARVLAPPSPFVRYDGALALVARTDTFADRSAALADWAATARARWDLPGWRNESVVIRDEADARPLASIERALLRPLGLLLRSVQACVWTQAADGPRLWVARRAPTKPVDPNRLDALVAGGIAGFDDVASTLVRECAEEAGLAPRFARAAIPAGELELAYPTHYDGLPALHRERVALHELELPAGIVPQPVDGEHAEILTMTPAEALETIAAGLWTRDGAQASSDLIRRRGWIPVGP